MSGGLLQLILYGAQDMYLTGNPIMTYFKNTYRRYTNFAISTVEQQLTKSGNKYTAILQKNGDLISKSYIRVVLPDILEKAHSGSPEYRYTRWVDNIGHYLIDMVEVEIDNKIIDRHYSDWLEIWAQLTVPAEAMAGYRQMIGQDPVNVLGQPTGLQRDVFSTSGSIYNITSPEYSKSENVLKGRDIYIPLNFWFCNDYGLVLPVIAMEYSEIKININVKPIEDLIILYTDDINIPSERHTEQSSEFGTYIEPSADIDVQLWVDYIFLDSDERRRFCYLSHEYLITQVQRNTANVVTGEMTNISLNFNHCVKELIWIFKAFDNKKQYSNFTNTPTSRIPHYTYADSSGNIGISGLPTGSVYGDANITFTVENSGITSSETSISIEVIDTISGISNLTIENLSTILYKKGDIFIFGNTDKDYKVYMPVESVTNNIPKVYIPNIPVAQKGNYTFLQIYRPLTGENVYNSAYTGVTSSTADSFNRIKTWNELNRMVGYNCIRPMNSDGWSNSPMKNCHIYINSYQRFETQKTAYFTKIETSKHVNIPESPGIHVYSFCFKPDEFQPSGSCNFSKLKNVTLTLEMDYLYNSLTGLGDSDDGTIKISRENLNIYIFARNMNILRIRNGMCGVAYDS